MSLPTQQVPTTAGASQVVPPQVVPRELPPQVIVNDYLDAYNVPHNFLPPVPQRPAGHVLPQAPLLPPVIRPVPKRKRAQNPDPPRAAKRGRKASVQETARPGIIAGKPAPVGQPLVWSNRRQELCETLHYYNSYQSSWYHPQGDAQSMLLAKDETPRSYTSIDVIITRSTGGMQETAARSGVMVQSKDHKKTDLTVKALTAAHSTRKAIIVLANNKCDTLTTTMPHNFQVLEHYWITDIWWEKNSGFNVFKYRFERCDLVSQPWYAPIGKVHVAPDYSVVCHEAICNTCQNPSIQVYQIWICLNVTCKVFWTGGNGKLIDEGNLEFNPDFLHKRSAWFGEKDDAIRPIAFDPSQHADPRQMFSRDGWLGFWCNQCGKCSSREHWKGWHCECGNSLTFQPKVLTPEEANVNFDQDTGKLIPIADKKLSGTIKPIESTLGKYKVDSYDLLAGNRVIHIHSSKELNAHPNGPDQMFKEMQTTEELKLKRGINGPGNEKNHTTMLCSHFSQNFGMSYKYVVANMSTAFADAPPVVMNAQQRMTWAGAAVGMDMSKPFNEQLVVGYMAAGKMGYHDDGEKELASTVATLSLGSDAIMHFRYKAKYDRPPYDFKTKTFKPDIQVLPGVPFYTRRMLLQEYIAKNPDATEKDLCNKFTSHAPVRRILTGIAKVPAHEDLLQLRLQHGDIIIMQGADLQKYIEHQVKPLGCLRFALTCRHVLPQHIAKKDRWMGDIDLSRYPAYDGYQDCMPVPTITEVKVKSEETAGVANSFQLPYRPSPAPSSLGETLVEEGKDDVAQSIES